VSSRSAAMQCEADVATASRKPDASDNHLCCDMSMRHRCK
jgi:hypothetical protein